MTRSVFIGDEVTGAGFALAGLEVRGPDAAASPEAFAAAIEGADFVLVTAEAAARLPAALVAAAVARARPLVAVVPDMTGGRPPQDLAARVYAALGVET
ncbi:MAG TPA: V-type ATP synthase subunit F [Hyphomicrobiales bacterium]|nr:V-type ATP synthase subunit F [Kaistiaceae bacterium]HQF31654.1 V-type ATP synthase subunit F [Hyphomicrobiales bacterium]